MQLRSTNRFVFLASLQHGQRLAHGLWATNGPNTGNPRPSPQHLQRRQNPVLAALGEGVGDIAAAS
jgi:hypothetical protein